MADGDLTTVTFNSGRLVKNPTRFTGDFPYGGTALGLTRDVVVMPAQLKVELTAEEFGHITVDAVDIGRSWVVGCNLRGHDNDAYATVFPGVLGGGRGIRDTLSTPRVGALMSSRSCRLLFVPDDIENHRAVYLHRAIPLVDETAEIALQLASELLVPALFLAIPDASGNIFTYDLIGNVA